MYNNEYMYAIERSDEYLAHYGIRGMKWGVRKAKAKGNAKMLGRQYGKAMRKLAKLEKRAKKAENYKKRAIAYGVGAATAGGLAAAGTHGVGNAINAVGKYGGKAMKGLGRGMDVAGVGIHKGLAAIGQGSLGNRIHKGMQAASRGLNEAGRTTNVGAIRVGEGLKRWGNSNSIGKAAEGVAKKTYSNALKSAMNSPAGRQSLGNINSTVQKVTGKNISGNIKGLRGVSNNTIARIGAGAIGVGLAAASAKNAYRAATAQKKAARFKSEMNKAFAGTQYANGGAPRQGKKRRRK